MTTIREIMSQPAVTCHAQDTLHHAAYLMWEHEVGSVVVLNDDERLVGILTDRDVAMAAYARSGSLRDILVHEEMSKDSVTCTSDDPLEVAEERMRQHGVRRLPVVTPDRRVLGLISLVDIANRRGLVGGAAA